MFLSSQRDFLLHIGNIEHIGWMTKTMCSMLPMCNKKIDLIEI